MSCSAKRRGPIGEYLNKHTIPLARVAAVPAEYLLFGSNAMRNLMFSYSLPTDTPVLRLGYVFIDKYNNGNVTR